MKIIIMIFTVISILAYGQLGPATSTASPAQINSTKNGEAFRDEYNIMKNIKSGGKESWEQINKYKKSQVTKCSDCNGSSIKLPTGEEIKLDSVQDEFGIENELNIIINGVKKKIEIDQAFVNAKLTLATFDKDVYFYDIDSNGSLEFAIEVDFMGALCYQPVVIYSYDLGVVSFHSRAVIACDTNLSEHVLLNCPKCGDDNTEACKKCELAIKK